jgi:hypothetical protein
MPPRFAYWTILIDQQPTAFRARELEELLPTLRQLRRTNKDVVLKWFAHGKLWESPEAQLSADQKPQDKRGRDWRPGGTHEDPRKRFEKRGDKRQRNGGGARQPDRWGKEAKPSNLPARPKWSPPGDARGPRGRDPRPWGNRPPPRGFSTRPAGKFNTRPAGKFSARPAGKVNTRFSGGGRPGPDRGSDRRPTKPSPDASEARTKPAPPDSNVSKPDPTKRD